MSGAKIIVGAASALKDNGALLAAVAAARAQPALLARGQPPPPPASGGLASDDPLAHTLQALFPDGIVATLGDRTITVQDVRRQITPELLARLRQQTAIPDELRQHLYDLQNNVIADLVTRELLIKEFHNRGEDEPSKSIAAEMVNNAIADRVKENFNNDETAFAAYLAAQGLTPAQYRQTVEEDIISAYMRGQQRRLASAKAKQPQSPPR